MQNQETNEIVIQAELVETFNNISARYAQIFSKLGQITISKNNIELEQDRLMEQYANNQSKQKQLIQQIRIKYGNGKINTQTWTFKPE